MKTPAFKTRPKLPDTPERVVTQVRKALAIDRDDLDECVSQQPVLYEQIAEQHALAISERDTTKLDLEEAVARESKRLRDAAQASGEKWTDTAIRQQITLLPVIMELERLLLQNKARVDALGALRDAYEQRSHALGQLVRMYVVRRLGNASITATHGELADDLRLRLGEERSRRGAV